MANLPPRQKCTLLTACLSDFSALLVKLSNPAAALQKRARGWTTTTKGTTMQRLFRFAPILAALGIAACDEIAVANDPVALSELRGQKSCVAAVAKQTGASGVAANTTLPVIELYRFIIDVPNAPSWTCVTDENGKAQEIVERRNG